MAKVMQNAYITKEQKRWLAELSRERSLDGERVSVAELIREAIDLLLEKEVEDKASA